MPNYFLISLSNEKNLKLCMEYKLAGFTNSINGFWTFTDIDEGDYISFLYAARVKNLYKVVKKVAYMNAENIPPWSPITFKESGKTYYFPFRLILKQERILDEPMVRPEFSYIAENLLLRGGYRKTHFQADAITFYNVSNMGVCYHEENKDLQIDGETFEPKIVFQKKKEKIPERFCFQELILQSLIKKKIKDAIFRKVMEYFSLNYNIEDFEFLSEKALPEGYVDIFVKLKHPIGSNKYILIEVKTGKAKNKDVEQLRKYINELKSETVGGLLIAQSFSKNIKNNIDESMIPIKYFFEGIDREGEYSYSQLLKKLRLEIIY